MGKNSGKYCLIIVLASIFFSCNTSKQSYYFKSIKADTSIARYVSPGLEPKIKPGDVLSIRATSLSKEEDLIFNQSSSALSEGASNNNPGYTVENDGYILLPRIGKIKVDGMTRQQLAEDIKIGLQPFMKGAVVRVSFLNHKVTILGEVAKPQVLSLSGDQITLLDALAMSGDITKDGNKKNLLVIREDGNEKIIKHINLEEHSIFSSPWYYLQANDIVYVMPDAVTKEREDKRRNTQSLISMVVSGASLLIIILDRIFK